MPLSEEQIVKMTEKRVKILEEAITLFAEYGYEATTIKQIAKAAGVSFGSIFTYFENKDDLFHTAIVEPLEEYSKQLLNFNPDAETVFIELENMVRNQINRYANFGPYLKLVVQVIGYPQRFSQTFKVLDEFHYQFRLKLKKLIENGQKKGVLLEQDPMFVATSYTCLLMGLRVNLADDAESKLWEDFVPYALQLFGPKRV